MLSGGCAVNPALRIAEAAPQAGPLRVEVPFHPQTGYQCGPAALGTVLGASGVETSPEALAPQVYLPGRRGSLQLELVAATRRAGRIPYVIDGTPQALFAELAQGRPVLVLQNLWVRTVPRWHYAVLVGADPARNRVLLNSGNRKGLEMRAPAFLRTWDWAGRWAMVALRPGELPADADPARYFAAVADFEEVAGTQAAEPAWRAALAAWPQDHRPRLALGNQAYAAGDLPAAVRHYREGLRLPPARRPGARQQPGQRAVGTGLPCRGALRAGAGPAGGAGAGPLASGAGADRGRDRSGGPAARPGLRPPGLSGPVRDAWAARRG